MLPTSNFFEVFKIIKAKVVTNLPMEHSFFLMNEPFRPSRGPERNPKGVQTASYEQLLRGFQNYQGKSSDEPSYGALLFFNERTVQALRRA
jgi:hypothetical protein